MSFLWTKLFRRTSFVSSKISAGIFKQSMSARNRVGTGLSYRPARPQAEWIPRKRILGFLKSLKFGLSLASASTVQYEYIPFYRSWTICCYISISFFVLWCKFKIHSHQIREHWCTFKCVLFIADRARICKRLRSTRIDSKESIPPAGRYDNPTPIYFSVPSPQALL